MINKWFNKINKLKLKKNNNFSTINERLFFLEINMNRFKYGSFLKSTLILCLGVEFFFKTSDSIFLIIYWN